MRENNSYIELFYEHKKLYSEQRLLKQKMAADSCKTRNNMKQRLREFDIFEAQKRYYRAICSEESAEQLEELRHKMMEIHRKEMERQKESQKRKIAKNKEIEKTFLSEHQYTTIGSEALYIKDFLKLHFTYDSTHFLLESDKDILPKKYISNISFKVSGSEVDEYSITAKILFKNEFKNILLASVGTKNAAYFLMRKLIKFYVFQGFNVENDSGFSIMEEEE